MSQYRADCSRCCGLCCVVPDQLRVQGFMVDKRADSPCVYLDNANRCSIHSTRSSHGYAACESFDCFGAGQWITQSLFEDAKWTDSPDVAQQMFAAYRYWLPRFETAAMIEAALPYVSDAARPSLAARIRELTTGKTGGQRYGNDPVTIRRRALLDIRSALKTRCKRS